MPCHVVLTCNYSPWSRYRGGGQKSTHLLASALGELGLRVDVVYTKALGERIPIPADLPYRVRWAPFVGLRPDLSSPLRYLNGVGVARAVRALSTPETLVVGNGDEAALLWCVSRREALVHMSRCGYDARFAGCDWDRSLTWFRALRRPRLAAMALAMRRADLVSFTSMHSLREAAAVFPFTAAKGFVLPNGIDPAMLSAPLPDGPGCGILFFGRLTRLKGVDTLLEAYGRLAPDVRRQHPLRIVGDGQALDELRTQAGALALHGGGRVEFVGWRSSVELAREIAGAAVVALPSYEESFGNAQLETLAMGRPLATCRVGGVPEVVGDLADLVEPGDAPALAAVLAGLLRVSFTAEAAARRRRWVAERYSWAATARALLARAGSGPTGRA